MDKGKRKILKSPSVKRRSRVTPVNQRVTLERVLGLTTQSNAALACDPNTGTFAYPAGCVVVLFHPRRNKQSHIFNFSKKTLTSLAFSGDGKHLVTGESGHQPAVRVWDVEEKTQVAEFHGHKFGIRCVKFSPNLKYIVSIGTQHDMMVNVWNWKTGSKVASNKVSSKVNSVTFSEDGSFFITVGNRHVKFWYLDSNKSKINETVPLNGRNGILGDQRNNYFSDVAMGKGLMSKSVYCITQSGLLCEFNDKRLLDKWVELRTNVANCISTGEYYIFVGCANGVVRVFDAATLHFVCTLPRPHYLGVDVASATNPRQMPPQRENAKYPDVVAVVFDDKQKHVTCIYNDHSLYVWDVHDMRKVGKVSSFLYHSSCVYGLEIYPSVPRGMSRALPPGSFITCSSDDTIRIWNLDPHMQETDTYKKNIYCHELMKVIYIDPTLTYLCDKDYNPSGGVDKTDTNYDDKNGVRTIRASPDGQHLASGDRQGNIRVHDLHFMDEVRVIEAHDSEVLCIEYSYIESGPKLLATTSRDRLIHVFDVEQEYGLLQTLDDHSSSITAVKFTNTDNQIKMLSCGADKSLLFRNAQIPECQFVLHQHLVGKTSLYDMDVDPSHKFAVTACQDRNLRIYNIKTAKHKKSYKASLTDDGVLIRVQLDPSGSYAVTSCTDKNLCFLDFYTGELLATVYGHSEVATAVKFMNDFKHLISVSGDGCIFVWRLPVEMTKQIQSRLKELDKLPLVVSHNSVTSKKEDVQSPSLVEDQIDAQPQTMDIDEGQFFTPQKVLNKLKEDSPDFNTSPSLDFRTSVSQLPTWARARFACTKGKGSLLYDSTDNSSGVTFAPVGKILSPEFFADSFMEQDTGSQENSSETTSTTQQSKDTSSQQARGRWAQRVENLGIVIKSHDGKTIEVDPSSDRPRFTYEADELSKQLADIRRETMVLDHPEVIPKNIPVIFDDETNDDDDDDDDFFPTFHKKEKTNRDSNVWDDLYNLDNDELEQPSDAEIIYYPTSEGSDTLASIIPPVSHNQSEAGNGKKENKKSGGSYRVFAAKEDGDARLRSRLSKHSFSSLDRSQDADSESTDPISLEDTEEDEDSGHSAGPTTPMDDPKTPNRERFLKDAFENLSFTPQLSIEKFECGLDNLEKEISQDPLASSRLINSRLSISARFLSRNQQDRNRNVAVQRQDNWFDSVQRNKDEMARKLDETKQRLQAMGWKSASPEEEHTDTYEPGPPVLDATLTPSKMSSALVDDFENQKTPTNFQFDQTYSLNRLKEEKDRPSSPKTPKSLRRCWSILDLPKQPIPEELATGAEPLSVKAPGSENSGKQNDHVDTITNSKHPQRSKIPSPQMYCTSYNHRTYKPRGDDGTDDGLNAPTRSSVSKTARPRSLSLGRDELNQKETKPSKEISKQQSRTSTGTTTRTTAPSNVPKKVDNNGNKMSLTSRGTKQRQSKPSTNLSKSKSTSMQSLSISKELSSIKGKMVKEVPIKGKDWTEPKLSSYSSEPDLLLSDEENFEKYDYKIGPPRSGLNSDMSKSVPDFSAEYKLARKSPHLSLVSESNRNSTGTTQTQKVRQGTTGRSSLSSTFKIGTEEQKSTPPSTASRKSTGSTSLKSENSHKGDESHKKDKELMPPPTAVGAPRGKQDKYTKKTVQTKRKPSELTLDQAKNILLGKSGILNGDNSTGDKGKHKRELPSLSSSNSVSKSSNASTDRIHSSENDSLSDPKFLSVASEIESTAAELRLISALNVNPDDLPERDIPIASQVPSSNKSSSQVSSNAQSAGKNYLSKDVVIVDLNSQKHSKEIRSLDSSFSSQDEDLSSSPSVKERIAQLNRSTDQHRSSSPLRERTRDASPLPVKYTTASPRITSSCSMSISTSSAVASHISSHTVTTAMTSVTGAPVSSSATIPHVSSHGKIQDFQGHSAFHAFQYNSEGNQTSSKSVLVGAVMDNSKPSTVKVTEAGSGVVSAMPGNMHSVPGPGMILSSSDTDLLPKHLSPGSSHSPRSTTDTGVGSDTDTELNNSVSQTTFRQLKIQSVGNDGHSPSDFLTLCEAAMEDLMRAVKNATELYQKISSHRDEKSMETSKRMKDAFQDAQNTLACLTQSRKSAPDISQNVMSTKDLPCTGSTDLPPETVKLLEKFMEPVLYNLTDTLTRTIADKLTDISDSMNGKLSVMSDLLKRRIDNLP